MRDLIRIIPAVIPLTLATLLGCDSPEPVGAEPAGDFRPASATALQLPAGSAPADQYHEVKEYADAIVGTFQTTVYLPSGSTLEAWSLRERRADAVLVAYVETGMVDSVRGIAVVDIDNDRLMGVNAYIKWKNESGEMKAVNVVAFSKTPTTSGSADVYIRIDREPSVMHASAPVSGKLYVHHNQTPDPGIGCIPVESRITASLEGGAGIHQFPVYDALAVDYTERSGLIMSVPSTKSGRMGWLAEGGYNFLLVFAPQSRSGATTPAGVARIIQEDGYDCP